VRANLSEPEPKLRERLNRIYEQSESAFVKENVAVFVNMTPETFSGVYANAVKETHWLSYPNYAALVSGGASPRTTWRMATPTSSSRST
jgi:type IV secretion system protein VirD4